jgi:hypothetical protein
MENEIREIIFDIVKSIGMDSENGNLKNPDGNTGIFGANGNFNSLAFVNLIADIEEKISAHFNEEIAIISEKALRLKPSPFHNINTLTGYIAALLGENNAQ